MNRLLNPLTKVVFRRGETVPQEMTVEDQIVPPDDQDGRAGEQKQGEVSGPLPLLGICVPQDLPRFGEAGFLPPGIHESSLAGLYNHVVTNEVRGEMWVRFIDFLSWVVLTKGFSHVYLGGSYISSEPSPSDIDVILHCRHPFGTKAIKAIEPFFARGLDHILVEFSVHLHFWIDKFPSGCDFRSFFQYTRPSQSKSEGHLNTTKRGVVRLTLLPSRLSSSSASPNLSTGPLPIARRRSR